MFFKIFDIPNTPIALTFEEWDNWKLESKKKYPFRYWLQYVLLTWLRVKKMLYIDTPIYWVKSFLIRKDHLLDLRGGPSHYIEDNYKYKWGYTDPCNMMTLAIYKVLKKFEKECDLNYGGINKRVSDLLQFISETDADDLKNNFKSEIDSLQKINSLILFFEIELPRIMNEDNTDHLKNDFEDIINQKLIEAIQVRNTLWT